MTPRLWPLTDWYLQQLAASDALLYRLRYGALAPPLNAAEQLQAKGGGPSVCAVALVRAP